MNRYRGAPVGTFLRVIHEIYKRVCGSSIFHRAKRFSTEIKSNLHNFRYKFPCTIRAHEHNIIPRDSGDADVVSIHHHASLCIIIYYNTLNDTCYIHTSGENVKLYILLFYRRVCRHSRREYLHRVATDYARAVWLVKSRLHELIEWRVPTFPNANKFHAGMPSAARNKYTIIVYLP